MMGLLLSALRDSLAGLECRTRADADADAMATAATPGSAPGCGELLALTDRYIMCLALTASHLPQMPAILGFCTAELSASEGLN